MRRKSIRRDRYIGGTASARVRGPSFFGVVVFILGETGNTWIMHGKLWHGCRAAVPAQWQEGGGVGETKVCPLCDRRLLDVKRDRAYEVAFELRCPHCRKIVRIVLPARAGLKN